MSEERPKSRLDLIREIAARQRQTRTARGYDIEADGGEAPEPLSVDQLLAERTANFDRGGRS